MVKIVKHAENIFLAARKNIFAGSTSCKKIIGSSVNFNMADALHRSCKSCQFLLQISLRFCPNCGEPFTEFAALECLDEEDLIRYYFNCGFTYRSIVAVLEKRHIK